MEILRGCQAVADKHPTSLSAPPCGATSGLRKPRLGSWPPMASRRLLNIKGHAVTSGGSSHKKLLRSPNSLRILRFFFPCVGALTTVLAPPVTGRVGGLRGRDSAGYRSSSGEWRRLCQWLSGCRGMEFGRSNDSTRVRKPDLRESCSELVLCLVNWTTPSLCHDSPPTQAFAFAADSSHIRSGRLPSLSLAIERCGANQPGYIHVKLSSRFSFCISEPSITKWKNYVGRVPRVKAETPGDIPLP